MILVTVHKVPESKEIEGHYNETLPDKILVCIFIVYATEVMRYKYV